MALTARMVTVDRVDPAGPAKSWTEAARPELGWQHEDQLLILGPTRRNGVRLGPMEVEGPVRSGASVVDEPHVPGRSRTVLPDPEGNKFCVSGAHG